MAVFDLPAPVSSFTLGIVTMSGALIEKQCGFYTLNGLSYRHNCVSGCWNGDIYPCVKESLGSNTNPSVEIYRCHCIECNQLFLEMKFAASEIIICEMNVKPN